LEQLFEDVPGDIPQGRSSYVSIKGVPQEGDHFVLYLIETSRKYQRLLPVNGVDTH